MVMNDKHEAEKAEAKNNVEEYVYEMRDKVYSKYESYVAEEVHIQYLTAVQNYFPVLITSLSCDYHSQEKIKLNVNTALC